MKNLLFLMFVLPSITFAQLPGLSKTTATDTLVVDGISYSVKITGNNEGSLKYYLLSDKAKKERVLLKQQIDRYVKVPEREKGVSYLEQGPLVGKELLIQVRPFSPSLSKFWQVAVDDGVNGNYLFSDQKGNKIKFVSEMAIVNYFVGRGWNLHEIQLVEKGSVGAGGSFLKDTLVGGNITLSSNVYFFKAVFKGY